MWASRSRVTVLTPHGDPTRVAFCMSSSRSSVTGDSTGNCLRALAMAARKWATELLRSKSASYSASLLLR